MWVSRVLHCLRSSGSWDKDDHVEAFGLRRRAAFLAGLRRDFLNSRSHHRMLPFLLWDGNVKVNTGSLLLAGWDGHRLGHNLQLSVPMFLPLASQTAAVTGLQNIKSSL